MQNLLDELKELFQQDERLMVEGRLLKNRIIELALKLDENLIKLLLSHPRLRRHFFVNVSRIANPTPTHNPTYVVFDKEKFLQFVSHKAFLPDSYTAFSNKIGLTGDGGKTYLSRRRDVVLAWPYKDCVLEGGQTKDDAKRDEVFWNITLAPDDIDRLLDPKVLTNFRRIDAGGERPATEIADNDNLIIKGNNLLALHSLLPRFRGRVKLIYIDPPYNPDSKANTFCYNNSFNHSTWLTFIKNRLEVAKKLLTDDGVLIIAVDDNEQAHLGVLLKEMFDKYEVHCITIVHNPRGVQGRNFSYTHEYAFFVLPKGKKVIGDRQISEEDIYWSNLRNWGGESLREDAKNCFYPIIVKNSEIVGFGEVLPEEEHPPTQTVQQGNKSYVYPIDNNGIERKWRYARQSVEGIEHLLRVRKKKNGNAYEIEIGKDFGTYRTVWIDPRYDANEYGTKIVKSLVPNCEFDFPKSLYNVYDCIYAVIGQDKNAIILDFFAGSGTTAHAVLELNKEDGGNRQFILCEQLDYVEAVTIERVKRVIENNGRGAFTYCELLQWNGRYVDQIGAAQSAEEIQALWEKMQAQAFLSYKVDYAHFDEHAEEFAQLSLADQKRFLLEVLDKNQLYVNLSEIEDTDYQVSEEDKRLNRMFYVAR